MDDVEKGEEGEVYKIEIPANRYDLLCIEGLSRALRVFLGKEVFFYFFFYFFFLIFLIFFYFFIFDFYFLDLFLFLFYFLF